MKTTRLIFILAVFAGTGCFSFEHYYYQNVPVEEYFRPEDMEQYPQFRGVIPPELIAADSFVSGSDTIYAFWALQPADTCEEPDSSVITLLYHPGTYHNINFSWGKIELLWELGYRVFIYDYPGYGRSTGEPCCEGCFCCSEHASSLVCEHRLVDTARLVYYGSSLGSFMATYLAAECWSPPAMILESAPASSSALLKDSGLLGLSGGLLSPDDFDNEKRIGLIGCPLLMMHGKADDYIVFEHHALVLWELAAQPKDSFWVEHANHGDLAFVTGEAYGNKIGEFLFEYLD